MRSFLLVLALLASAFAADPKAESLFKQGEKAEKDGKIVEAYLLYSQAAAAEPQNVNYWFRANALRSKAEVISSQKPDDILTQSSAPAERPENYKFDGEARYDMEKLERMAPPAKLQPTDVHKSFRLKGDAKSLFEAVAKEYGYVVIFERDYNPTGEVRFYVSDMDYRDGLHALETATNSFIVPLSPRVMLVAQDTTQKRTELEANVTASIPIPDRTSLQEAQELMMLVQQALETRRCMLDPQKRTIVVRDRAAKVELARAIIHELSVGKTQVGIELEFISVGKTSSLDFGLRLQTSFPLVNFGSVLNSKPSIPAGFARFLAFGGGATFLGLGIADAGLFATASRSSATTLQRSQLTASDGQAATLHIGDKYPILTGGYVGSGGLPPGSTTLAMISTATFPDQNRTQFSTTGTFNVVINNQAVPITLQEGFNTLEGVIATINSANLGIGAAVIERGTEEKPITLLVVANSLDITSIQIVDDPDKAKINLLKLPEQASSITRDQLATADETAVSLNGALSLVVGEKSFAISLSETANNLNGLRDAINTSGAGVVAAVLTTGVGNTPYFLQVVANDKSTGAIQLFDDPDGDKIPLLAPTDEVNRVGVQLGNTVQSASNTSTSGLGQVYAPPPIFNFEDLGIVIKVTPWVHNLDEITLDVESEFKVLGSGSYNGVPVISMRKYQGKVRLKTSEWAVVAGLVSTQDTKSVNGLPGLMHIPFFGALFRENQRSKDQSEVLLVIKPRILSMPASETVTKTYLFGTETRPLSPL